MVGSPPADILGIRHHGPGSARAIGAALAELKPDIVLIEGPPEADGLVELVGHPQMRPPVAILAYAEADPAKAAFWPFAEFSPEWIAMRYAVDADVPVRFCDLPAAYLFGETSSPDSESDPAESRAEFERGDPIAALAEAAGYDDPERWWEDVVEQRADGTVSARDSFHAIAEAMTAVRDDTAVDPRDLQREAHMRQTIRAAAKDGFERIAVVCGAFHVPALLELGPATRDLKILRELPRKVKTTATWVPWTHNRLALRSGYGAGITAPGWYRHLFTAPDRVVERWLARVAELLREKDFPVSSAHLIEATRLAETLAVLRGRTLAGLSEVTEAVESVLCAGSETPMELIRERLVIGDELGDVPPEIPVVPLAADVAAQQRTLRLKPTAGRTEVELDLRKPRDADKSRLLHRLAILGIDWGAPQETRGTGTFKETWALQWHPEYAIRLVEAAVWGTTVSAAAAARATDRATAAKHLPEMMTVVETCLLADLSEPLGPIMALFADRAAVETDVVQLADALPALARTLRYGDVRGTDTAALRTVADTLVVRLALGFAGACAGLDNDGAQQMRVRMERTHQAITLLDNAESTSQWQAALRRVSDREGMTGVLAGRATRLRYDAGDLDAEELNRRMGLALTPGVPPAEAAAWLEGILSGGAMLLIHDSALLGLLDRWVDGIPAESFTDVLPLLRRTFAEFEGPERRKIGELVRRGPEDRPAGAQLTDNPNFDRARADRALAVVALLLGEKESE